MLRNESFTLTVAEVEWLTRALPTDLHLHRPVLTVGAIAYYNGAAVIVTTDTHRLHILRLGPVDEEFPVKLIDLRRVLMEAQLANAKHVQIAGDFSEVSVGHRFGNTNDLTAASKIHAPVFDTLKGDFPRFQRVIPETTRPVHELFAINSQYLADATRLSREDSCRTIMYSENAESRPIVFRPAIGDRWLALVMPMGIEGWAKQANEEAKANAS